RPVAASGGVADRPADELWLIDCRALTTVRSATQNVGQSLRPWRFDQAHRKWQRVPQEEFLEAARIVMPTCVWVHGDRVDCDLSFQIGREVYQQLVCNHEDEAPIRFVIWSWPTTQELRGRPLKDARIKAARSDAAGYSLAWTLNELDPAAPVSLLGFSFGARVVTGAVHVAAGGQLGGYGISVPDNRSALGYQVVLMAAAMDNNWLQPGRKHDQAIHRIDQLLLLNNHQDWVLKRYHLLKCGNGCQALGYTGLSVPDSLADRGDAVCQVNAGAYIGKLHRWAPYIYTEPLMNKTRKTALSPLAAPMEVTTNPESAPAVAKPSGDDVAATRAAGDQP
ncbi:MAG: hypothetical protein OES79_16035, partial [Planctomycetota bacterium]|nr:hypothetical protein [Planctomycetota bacterium]